MLLPIEDAIDLQRAAARLRGHKRTVFWLRAAGYTLVEVGKYLRLTRERVRQIEAQMHREIREWLARDGRLAVAMDRATRVIAARRAEDAVRHREYITQARRVAPPIGSGFRRCAYEHCPTPHQRVSRPRTVHLACTRLRLARAAEQRRQAS